MAIKDHRDLLVWQKAMDLVAECYRVTRAFPKDEQFGLTSQLKRAAVSIPANTAEGYGRSATKAFRNHLSIACGSLKELERTCSSRTDSNTLLATTSLRLWRLRPKSAG